MFRVGQCCEDTYGELVYQENRGLVAVRPSYSVLRRPSSVVRPPSSVLNEIHSPYLYLADGDN